MYNIDAAGKGSISTDTVNWVSASLRQLGISNEITATPMIYRDLPSQPGKADSTPLWSKQDWVSGDGAVTVPTPTSVPVNLQAWFEAKSADGDRWGFVDQSQKGSIAFGTSGESKDIYYSPSGEFTTTKPATKEDVKPNVPNEGEPEEKP